MIGGYKLPREPKVWGRLGNLEKEKCPTCKGTGKIPYSHTPQVGEWVIYEDKVYLIYQVGEEYAPSVKANKISIADLNGYLSTSKEFLSPILEWEEIERVVKQAGYRIDICPGYECTIIGGGSKCLAKTLAKDRLTVVYKAVIALGKEI